MNAFDKAQKIRPDIEKILGIGKSQSTTLFENRRTQIIAGVLTLAALLLIVMWSSGGSKSALRYVTEPVTRAILTVIVTATGTVQPTNKVDVSSELSGTIRKVLVDFNSTR